MIGAFVWCSYAIQSGIVMHGLLVFLEFAHHAVQLLGEILASRLHWSVMLREGGGGQRETYPKENGNGSVILQARKVNLLRLGLLALPVAYRHSLENGRVQHHAQHSVCAHDHPSRLLVLHSICDAHVDLEGSDTALFPLLVCELEQLRLT